MAQEINSHIDPLDVSSLTLAFVGDSFYELILRERAVMLHNGNVNSVNKYTKHFSNARTQAQIAQLLAECFTEEELQIYKRGRNAKSVSAPRSCTISEYRRATGLEALCGSLFLSGQIDRARELITLGIEKFEESENSDHE